jgi:hypothetical protein
MTPRQAHTYLEDTAGLILFVRDDVTTRALVNSGKNGASLDRVAVLTVPGIGIHQ